MQVEIAGQADEQLFEAFQHLIPQLTDNNPPPSRDQLATLLSDPSSRLLIARDDQGGIVGALTLVIYRVPTGIRCVIEDVIVDRSARGQGIGEALMKHAIQIARVEKAGNISLTSNAMRESANRLYIKLGFKKRETNAYQLRLG